MRRAAGVAAACLITSVILTSVAFGGQAVAAPNTPGPSPSPSPTVTAPILSNPFPSSTPSESPSPGINGFATLLFDVASGSGGNYVPAGSTAPPLAFPATGGRGFTIDVAGKLSRVFAASLRLQDDSFHGGDRPLLTTTEGAILYDPKGARGSVGLGIVSFQRSNGVMSATGGGFGGMYLPDTDHHLSAFGKLFFYPSLSFPDISGAQPAKPPQRGSLFTYQLGLAVAPHGGGGLFFNIGLGGRTGGPSSFSPQTVNALQLGIGSTF